MSKPRIASTTPSMMQLEQGKKYAWCTCGESAKEDLCDGAHKTTGSYQPLVFEAEADEQRALCRCKRTATPPYCDGSHAALR